MSPFFFFKRDINPIKYLGEGGEVETDGLIYYWLEGFSFFGRPLGFGKAKKVGKKEEDFDVDISSKFNSEHK